MIIEIQNKTTRAIQSLSLAPESGTGVNLLEEVLKPDTGTLIENVTGGAYRVSVVFADNGQSDQSGVISLASNAAIAVVLTRASGGSLQATVLSVVRNANGFARATDNAGAMYSFSKIYGDRSMAK